MAARKTQATDAAEEQSTAPEPDSTVAVMERPTDATDEESPAAGDQRAGTTVSYWFDPQTDRLISAAVHVWSAKHGSYRATIKIEDGRVAWYEQDGPATAWRRVKRGQSELVIQQVVDQAVEYAQGKFLIDALR